MPMGTGNLREVKRAATRRTLARTTYEMVLQRGVEEVTVDEVTSAVQLSRRTFSNYFSCKEEAVVEVLLDTVADGLAGWSPTTGTDLLGAVRSLVEHQFAGDVPGVLAALGRLCAEHPQLVPFCNDALWRAWGLMVGQLRSTVGPGGPEDEADLAMVAGALYGVVASHVVTGPPTRLQPQAQHSQQQPREVLSPTGLATGLTRVLARLEVALGPDGDAAVRAAQRGRRAEIAGRGR